MSVTGPAPAGPATDPTGYEFPLPFITKAMLTTPLKTWSKVSPAGVVVIESASARRRAALP